MKWTWSKRQNIMSEMRIWEVRIALAGRAATNARFEQTVRILLRIGPATSQAFGSRCLDRRDFRKALCTPFHATTGQDGVDVSLRLGSENSSRELTRLETIAILPEATRHASATLDSRGRV